MRNRLGDPRADHESGNGECVFGSRIEIKRSEPENDRHCNRQNAAENFWRRKSGHVGSVKLRDGSRDCCHQRSPCGAVSFTARRTRLGEPAGSREAIS